MTSKAFHKTKNPAVVISPLSFAHFHSSTTLINATMVEEFLDHLCNLDPHVIDGLLCVGGRLCNASLPSERKNQIILPKEWHVTKLIIYNHYSICGHWQRARPSLISREVLYPTRKFYCQRHSLKVCELLSLIGAPLSTENG